MISKPKILFILLMSSTLISACGGYSKSCSDGVCTIVENGVTRYEGDAEKIAKIKANEEKAAAKRQELFKEIAEAPRKPEDEVIRIALVPMAHPDMKEYQDKYLAMIQDEFKKDKAFKVITKKALDKDLKKRKMNMALNIAFSNPGSLMSGSGVKSGSPKKEEAQTPQALAEDVQVFGGAADALVFIDIGVEKKTGMLKGATALATFTLPHFKTNVTSTYKFAEDSKSFMGESTSSVSAVGLTDKKKVAGFNLDKIKRSLKKDVPAIKSMAKFIKAKANTLRGTMPSLAALKKIHAKQNPDGNADPKKGKTKALMKGLKGLFKKK